MGMAFATTNWSLVLAARGDTPRAQEALAALCEAYWYPVYAFVRRQGRGADEARDLTQSYFLRLLEKGYLRQVQPEAGRFRSFLLASVKHFLANEWDRVRAQKRTLERTALSLDTDAAAQKYQTSLADRLDPERLFERQWATTVLERGLESLRREMDDGGDGVRFAQLKAYLTGEEPAAPYRDVAATLGISESAVRVAVHRMRQRFGQLLREEIARTVNGPTEVEEEIRFLLGALDR